MANYNDYIEGLKNKDEETFNLIYNKTKHTVYATIYAIVQNHTVCEDIMQDTYITMLEKIYQYQPKYSFLTWLTTIARNKAIDYYRKNKREVLVDINETDTFLPGREATGEKNLLIEEMLSKLSETERSIFLMRIVKRLKNREIAEIMDLPLGTVLWHYSQAVKKIKGGNFD